MSLREAVAICNAYADTDCVFLVSHSHEFSRSRVIKLLETQTGMKAARISVGDKTYYQ